MPGGKVWIPSSAFAYLSPAPCPRLQENLLTAPPASSLFSWKTLQLPEGRGPLDTLVDAPRMFSQIQESRAHPRGSDSIGVRAGTWSTVVFTKLPG